MNIKAYIKKKLVRVKKEKVIIPCLEGHILEGRKALVTGGSSGIGYSIAASFLKNGASVVICGRNISKLEEAKQKLITSLDCNKTRIQFLQLDISDIEEMKNTLQSFLANNIIDIFVNNAGVNGGDLFPNTLEEDYDKVLDTNLKGMYFISQEFAKYI